MYRKNSQLPPAKFSKIENFVHNFSTAELVQELCDRGALKIMQTQTYLPGIVQARYRGAVAEGAEPEDNPAVSRATAQALAAFSRALMLEHVISVERAPACELPQYANMPQSDVVITVALLVPNPAYEEPSGA